LMAFGSSVLLVRAMRPELFAEYSTALAILSLATLVSDAGGNSGLTRYLAEAGKSRARGTFYRRLQRRRFLVAGLCGAVLALLGPWYARMTHLKGLASDSFIFLTIGLIVAVSLARLLAHYGLVALFEVRKALGLQQAFLVGRSVVLAGIALLGGTLRELVAGLLAIALVEALLAHRLLWRLIGREQEPISSQFVDSAQKFGLLTIFDKACAALGTGSVLLLLLAPSHPAGQMALLALAADLVGKVSSITLMPMSNLILPYLSHVGDDVETQGRAMVRIINCSSLVFCGSIGVSLVVLPTFIPFVYGERYGGAVICALLLLVPTAYENWIRSWGSPTLLRNGEYKALSSLNLLQVVATLGTLWAVHLQSLPKVLIAVGVARAAVATLSFVPLARFLPGERCLTPVRGLAVSLVASAIAWAWAQWLPIPRLPRIILESLAFVVAFYLGLRWFVLRDGDTLMLAHRLAGARFSSWLLPPLNPAERS
jgi:O-antigen/teichoic acid export membrane protein